MKHQQVVVDYWTMVKTSCTCLLLAFSGYILIKMVQTIFWLPGYLQNNQKRLEELAAQYSLELDEEKKPDTEDNQKLDPKEKETTPLLKEDAGACAKKPSNNNEPQQPVESEAKKDK